MKNFSKYLNALRVTCIFALSLPGITGFTQSSQDTLTGIVDQQLIRINRNSGAIANNTPITGIPVGYDPFRLTWSEPNQCFYIIPSGAAPNADQLGKVSADGLFTILGSVTVPGETVYLIEGLGFNRNDGELYASCSLNGGPPADFWSETLIRIDTNTLVGTIIGTFNHTTPYEPEADVLTFGDNGKLYYIDGQPGGGGFFRVFEQDQYMLTASGLIYSTSYVHSSDLTVKDNVLYYSSNRQLRKIDLGTYVHSAVGNMFTPADFNGLLMRGISWRVEDCIQTDLIPDDTLFCQGSSVVLDGGNGSQWSYAWNNGWTDSIITISTPGTYQIEAVNGTCIITDSVIVAESPLPTIDAGVDDTVCLGQDVVLNASGAGPGGTYQWDSGVIDNVPFIPGFSADYIVTGTTVDGCGGTDTIHVELLIGDDPNFTYSEYLYCVQDGPALPNLIVTTGGIFSATPAGLSINSVTGQINPNLSMPGIYEIFYTIGGVCPNDSSQMVQIVPFPFIHPVSDMEYCENDLFTGYNFSISTGASVSWINDNPTIGLSTNGSGNLPQFLLLSDGIANIQATAFAGGCVGNTENFMITVSPRPTLNPLDQFACIGDTISLTVENPDSAMLSWFPDYSGVWEVSGNSMFTISADLNGCIIIDTLEVFAFPDINSNFTYNPNPLTILEHEANFIPADPGLMSYLWNFGDGFNSLQINPIHEFPETAGLSYTVTLTVEDINGCIESSSQVVVIKDVLIFYVPNVFTPNGDQYNNVFSPVFTSGFDPDQFHLTIFDRWGEIIFESYNATVGWRGDYGHLGLVEDGVYVWKIEFGLSDSDERKTVFGHVTVLK